MSKKQQIEELERRVRELELRPAYVPVYVPQYVPQYVRPYFLPYAPSQPWWTFYGGSSANQCVAGGMPQNAAIGNLIEQH